MKHDNCSRLALTSAADSGHNNIVKILKEAGASTPSGSKHRNLEQKGYMLYAVCKKPAVSLSKVNSGKNSGHGPDNYCLKGHVITIDESHAPLPWIRTWYLFVLVGVDRVYHGISVCCRKGFRGAQIDGCATGASA